MNKRGYFGIGIFHGKTETNIGTLWRSAAILGADNIVIHCRHRLPLDVDFTEYNYNFYKQMHLKDIVRQLH